MLLLSQRARQQLVPTQRMQFTLDVLALSAMELEERLSAVLHENLLVEPEDIGCDADHLSHETSGVDVVDGARVDYRHGERLLTAGRHDRRRLNRDGEDETAAERVAAPVSLAEHLGQQVRELRIDSHERAALEWLIGNLSERGYLEDPLSQLAELGGFPLEVVERAQQRLLTLSPVGCGARHMGECLAAQARQRWGERAERLAAALTADPRQLARPAVLRRLARGLGLSGSEELLMELRRFHPAPGWQYRIERLEAAPPDVFFVRQGSGWVVHLPESPLDRWRVRTEYVSGKFGGAETRRFLRPWMQELRMWRQALRLRQETLRNLCGWLLAEQPDFVEHGPRRLKPVTMTQAAQALGLSISTISRCVQNKRLHFVWGSFWFRDVFREVRIGRSQAGVESNPWNALPSWLDMVDGSSSGAQNGTEEAALPLNETIIRERLEAILAMEHAGCVYSDEALARQLREEGIAISRRCLTRYRQKWGIGTRGERLLVYRVRKGHSGWSSAVRGVDIPVAECGQPAGCLSPTGNLSGDILERSQTVPSHLGQMVWSREGLPLGTLALG